MNKIDMNYTILPGSLVSIKIGDNLGWILDIIYTCGDEYIDIPLTESLIKEHLLVDSKLHIKYKDEFFEYIIFGHIISIKLTELPFARVKIDSINENVNNRSFPRHDVCLATEIMNSKSEAIYCITSNISLSGSAIYTNELLELNQDYNMSIYLREDEPITVTGNILRGRQLNNFREYNLEFTCMDEENSNKLSYYLFSIDRHYDFIRSKYKV